MDRQEWYGELLALWLEFKLMRRYVLSHYLVHLHLFDTRSSCPTTYLHAYYSSTYVLGTEQWSHSPFLTRKEIDTTTLKIMGNRARTWHAAPLNSLGQRLRTCQAYATIRFPEISMTDES